MITTLNCIKHTNDHTSVNLKDKMALPPLYKIRKRADTEIMIDCTCVTQAVSVRTD